jgi:hypothetical protein
VRYLRLSTGVGDGAFSISEFAVFCKVPTPFPPKLRAVELPVAKGPAATAKSDDADNASAGRSTLLAIAAALVLLGIVGYGGRARKPSRERPRRDDTDDESDTDDDGADDGGADDGTRESARSVAAKSRKLLARAAAQARTEQGIRLMFLASGCAALTYEVVWFHLMRLVIGACRCRSASCSPSSWAGCSSEACCSLATFRPIGTR